MRLLEEGGIMAPGEERQETEAAAQEQESDRPQEAQGPPVAQRRPLDWMKDTLQWGVKAQPTDHGLTMRALNIGIYGEVPDETTEMSRMPRGAYPVPGTPRVDIFSITKKEELWTDIAPDLYEEAIQRRWAARTDIPWDTLTPLPEDVEIAMCQFCTELSQQASIEAEVLGQWIFKMTYAYHEVKNFLATQAFDSARHFEVFRLRALAMGGNIGLESPGIVNRRILESRAGWPETSILLYILRGSLTMLLYRYGEAFAHNPAEKMIFRRCIQDKARHLAYGMTHLKYTISQKGRDFATSLERRMIGPEQELAWEMKDPVLWEALAIIFGGGIRNMRAGMELVRKLQQQYLRQYMARIAYIGLAKTEENLNQELLPYLRMEEPARTGG